MGKNLYILGLFVATLLFSCSKGNPETLEPGDFTLEVSMPQAATKTVLGTKLAGEYPVLWSVGDYITVNGVQSRALTALEAGGSTAVFHFSQSVKTPYRVQYGTSVPASQLYSEGNIRGFCAPMQAVSSDASFTLKHQACILRIPLSGSVSVAGISVSSLDGTPLCEGGSVHLTMPAGGVSISSARTFCIALQPATLSKGLKVEIVSTAGARMSLISLVGETLEAGMVYEFPSTAFSANELPITVISTYAQLKDFATLVASGEKYLEARLVADITADGTWTPLNSFSGDFDGGGYTVSGLQKAFVNELCGCIRNLTVDGNITITTKDDIVGDETVYWAGILTNRMYTGALVSNCTVKGSISYSQWGKEVRVGPVCGYTARGTIENCVNLAAIAVTGDGSSAVKAGGMLGMAYSSSDIITIVNCRNEGTLSLSGTLKSPEVGGIAGQYTPASASILSGCSFTGDVTFESGSVISGNVNLGGIAGSVKTAALDGCVSAGTLTARSSSAGIVRAGGILGQALSYGDGSSIAVSDCAFSGSLIISIASHGTLNTNPFVGLYSTTTHTESGCENTGTITVE